MSRRPLPLLLLLLLLPAVLEAAPRRRAVTRNPDVWETPRCAEPNGLPSLQFATPGTEGSAEGIEGLDLVPTRSVIALATSPVANLLYAFFEGALYESRNAGCTWSLKITVPQLAGPVSIVATHPSRVYINSDEHIARLMGDLLDVIALPERFLRLFVDPRNALHLRAVAMSGAIRESHDGGTTWDVVGDVTSYGVYAATIDPTDFDHLLVATTEHGRVMRSRDGGTTWSRTTFPASNVWSIEFSPADARVIWAQGWEHAQQERIFRSTDGGETWTRLVTYGDRGVTFSRAVLAPHPTLADRVAVTTHQGVAVYVDATSRAVGLGANSRAIAWSPAGTLYYAHPVVVTQPLEE